MHSCKRYNAENNITRIIKAGTFIVLIKNHCCSKHAVLINPIRYPNYISQLEAVVKPEHLSAIEKLRALDPHNMVRPEHYFNSEAEAVGVVFRLF